MKRSLIIKLVLAVFAVLIVFGLLRMKLRIDANRKEVEALQTEITGTEQDIQRIRDAKDALETEEGVKDIARNKMDLVSPGEIVFQDVGNS